MTLDDMRPIPASGDSADGAPRHAMLSGDHTMNYPSRKRCTYCSHLRLSQDRHAAPLTASAAPPFNAIRDVLRIGPWTAVKWLHTHWLVARMPHHPTVRKRVATVQNVREMRSTPDAALHRNPRIAIHAHRACPQPTPLGRARGWRRRTRHIVRERYLSSRTRRWALAVGARARLHVSTPSQSVTLPADDSLRGGTPILVGDPTWR